MTTYEWELYPLPEGGIVEIFRFAQNYPRRVLGFLKKGGRKHPGWYVHQYRMDGPIATLPQTMGRDEAMTTAKLILLNQWSNP